MEQSELAEAVRAKGAVRLGAEDRLVLVCNEPLEAKYVEQITTAVEEAGLKGRAFVIGGLDAFVLPPRHDPEDAARRVLERVAEDLGWGDESGRPWDNRESIERAIAEAVYAEVEDANELRVALGKIADHEPVIASEAKLCRIAREALGR